MHNKSCTPHARARWYSTCINLDSISDQPVGDISASWIYLLESQIRHPWTSIHSLPSCSFDMCPQHTWNNHTISRLKCVSISDLGSWHYRGKISYMGKQQSYQTRHGQNMPFRNILHLFLMFSEDLWSSNIVVEWKGNEGKGVGNLSLPLAVWRVGCAKV